MEGNSISIELIQFSGTLETLKSNISDIDTSVTDVEEITCNAEVMKTYYKKCKKLSTLIKQYKELIEKDQEVLVKVKDTMVTKDIALSNMFAPNSSSKNYSPNMSDYTQKKQVPFR